MVVERGSIHRDTIHDRLVEVRRTVYPWDHDDHQCASIPLVSVGEGEPYSIFFDIFRSDYRRVADSREELDEEQQAEIAEAGE